MAKQDEIKVADFMEMKDLTQDQENNEAPVVETKKQNKVVTKFKNLKIWQKALIIGAGVAGVAVGGKVIYDLVSKNREVVTDVVETVSEAATNEGLEVTPF